jgi:hypothetical protein
MLTSEIFTFEQLIDHYAYYNCTAETGNYVSFYIKKEVTQ